MSTAGDVVTLIRTMGAMELEELGTTTETQNNALIVFINAALKELVHLAYRARVSDVLNITADGYQTFKRNSTDIADLYSPLRILDSTGRPILKRTAFDAPTGWWREADSQPLHTKNVTGNHTLHYIAYPTPCTDTNSTLDFPDAGLMGLAFWVCGLVKESRDAYEESQAMYNKANNRLKVLALANEAGRGTSSSGYVPSLNDIDRAFKY